MKHIFNIWVVVKDGTVFKDTCGLYSPAGHRSQSSFRTWLAHSGILSPRQKRNVLSMPIVILNLQNLPWLLDNTTGTTCISMLWNLASAPLPPGFWKKNTKPARLICPQTRLPRFNMLWHARPQQMVPLARSNVQSIWSKYELILTSLSVVMQFGWSE